MRPGQPVSHFVLRGFHTLSSFCTCHVLLVCQPSKFRSSKCELSSGLSATVSEIHRQELSLWFRPLLAHNKYMEKLQEQVAAFVLHFIRACCLFSHCVNFAVKIKMFGGSKGLIPLLSLTTNCLRATDRSVAVWCTQVKLLVLHKLVGWTLAQSGLLNYGWSLCFHQSFRQSGDSRGSVHEPRKALNHAASSYHF